MWSWLSDGWSRLPAIRELFRGGTGTPARARRNGSAAKAADVDGSLQRIAAEFERARRYERSVTVAVFALDPSGAAPGPKGNGSLARASNEGGHASPSVHLCPVVREAVRETDLVVCDPVARRCVVVMPEIGAEEGQRAVSRMRELCAARLQCPVRGDLAVFPRDGWVFPDLVEVAEKQAQTAGATMLISRQAVGS